MSGTMKKKKKDPCRFPVILTELVKNIKLKTTHPLLHKNILLTSIVLLLQISFPSSFLFSLFLIFLLFLLVFIFISVKI